MRKCASKALGLTWLGSAASCLVGSSRAASRHSRATLQVYRELRSYTFSRRGARVELSRAANSSKPKDERLRGIEFWMAAKKASLKSNMNASRLDAQSDLQSLFA